MIYCYFCFDFIQQEFLKLSFNEIIENTNSKIKESFKIKTMIKNKKILNLFPELNEIDKI